MIDWITPDDGFWVVVRAFLAGLWTVLVVTFVVGWVRARRAGDLTAQVDARLVLAAGAIVALGVAVVVENMSNTTTTATIVMGILLPPALGAYLYVAARAGQEPSSKKSR